METRLARADLFLTMTLAFGCGTRSVQPVEGQAAAIKSPDAVDVWHIGPVVSAELETWTVFVDAGTLRVRANRGPTELVLSEGLAPSRPVGVTADGDTVSWTRAATPHRVRLSVRSDTLAVELGGSPGDALTWPVRAPVEDSLSLPISEGLFVPADDSVWQRYFAEEDCLSTHGELSMPALALHHGPVSATYLWPDDLQNNVCVSARGERLTVTASKQLRARDRATRYRVEVSIGDASPVAPAKAVRQWLRRTGALRTLTDKARDVPHVERLFGATHLYLYGDGRTIESLDRLRALGMSRLWLGYDQDGREDRHVVDRPVIEHAKRLGFLIGPYDTHDNVQAPASADTPFSDYGEDLFQTGGIVRADGTRAAGFGGRGYALSSAALRQTHHYEDRVASFVATGIDSYFLDCDAFGQLFDDYDPNHPMTQDEDRGNRQYRLAILSKEHGLVAGSESAAAWSLVNLHFTHGPHTVATRALWPIISDAAVFGGWAPYLRPEIFFRSIQTPQALKPLFDPRYRIPLYQAAFHDLVVSTDRWEFSPVKLTDQVKTRSLAMILYGVPAVWTVDARMLREHGERLAAHNRVFEPLHRVIASQPLTSFGWVTDDRLVQRTRFGAEVEITANFDAKVRAGIDPYCAEIVWLKETDHRTIYCPEGLG